MTSFLKGRPSEPVIPERTRTHRVRARCRLAAVCSLPLDTAALCLVPSLFSYFFPINSRPPLFPLSPVSLAAIGRSEQPRARSRVHTHSRIVETRMEPEDFDAYTARSYGEQVETGARKVIEKLNVG